MISHAVETCPDDPVLLCQRLDELAQGGARIVSVLWQPQRLEPDQQAAYDARGSFLIVTQSELPQVIRMEESEEVARPAEIGGTPAL